MYGKEIGGYAGRKFARTISGKLKSSQNGPSM
jgi:hypothetical protein